MTVLHERTPTGIGGPPPAPAPISTPWTGRRIGLWSIGLVFTAVSLWSLVDIGVNPLTLFFERDDIGNLLRRMWPPTIQEFEPVWKATLDTFFMAFVGTALAFILALPLGFLAASNVVRVPALRAVARGIIVFTRAIPDLIFALIFVRVYSIGVLPGVLAIGLHSIGMLGKLFADSIEQIQHGPREGVQATGAGRFQEMSTGVLPQIVPSFIAITLYRLDINFRSSTLLGLVGAGGIGLQIRAYQGGLRYPELLGVTLLIIALIVIVEVVSTSVRATILGHERTRVGLLARLRGGPTATEFTPAPITPAEAQTQVTPSLRPPWTRERLTMYGFGFFSLVMLVLSFTLTDMSLPELITGLPEVPRVLWRLVPSSLDWWIPEFGEQLLETVLMGFAATFLALVFAIPTGFLAARNVAPAKWIYSASRLFILSVRALPDLIVAVIFVAALGLGPKPGVLALAIGLYGFATKLFADAIEEVSEAPRDGIRAVGASRLQETFSGVLPQVMPSLVGNSLYLLDVSIRGSTVLGIVGGGGIGFALLQGAKLLKWDLLGGLLIMIFVIVYGIELLSGWVRRRII
ncbi:MAG: phosphonate ABC transporter, permease protein PhnE [Acidimicrobiia bacterium]|nr:phosphonate ABC transporter, permease protein PhnE [Acidimicrobiia bacterium]